MDDESNDRAPTYLRRSRDDAQNGLPDAFPLIAAGLAVVFVVFAIVRMFL